MGIGLLKGKFSTMCSLNTWNSHKGMIKGTIHDPKSITHPCLFLIIWARVSHKETRMKHIKARLIRWPFNSKALDRDFSLVQKMYKNWFPSTLQVRVKISHASQLQCSFSNHFQPMGSKGGIKEQSPYKKSLM